jgi:uncharacterized membrane protein
MPDADIEPLVATAVLGLGFVAMALDVEAFWVVWVVGFAVVLPAVRWAREWRTAEPPREDEWHTHHRDTSRTADSSGAASGADEALATLRERYARGELSEAAFEAKLEALLETETPEGARERVTGDRDPAPDLDRET